MARETGTNPLINELLEEGHKFFFVQVMRLVRRHLEAGGTEGVPRIPWQERVRVRPRLSMAFPASDVAKVERDGDGFRITATFLGLYGAASPLPNFYTEELLDEAANEETVLRDFLDVINWRLYDLYLQCWSKYRLIIRIVEEDNRIDRERLLCLIGLGEKGLASSIPDAFSLLSYAGILTQFPRSSAGLRTILRDVFGIQSIRIIRNVKRMVSIPPDQRMRMGMSNCRLGIDTVLGSKIADRSGKFVIEFGPLTMQKCDAFLPGTANHEKLSRYVRFYLTDPLEVELKLVLAAGEARPIRIGDPKARLGLNMWCFSGESIGEVSAVYPLASPQTTPSPAKPEYSRKAATNGFADSFRKELLRLRTLADDFAAKHPRLAPRVGGHAADPGIERLLEGTAFYNAVLLRKLDDDFPEVIHEVMEQIQPESLRPIPAATIIAFTPKKSCTQSSTIPAGTQVNSRPLNGTTCRFRTLSDIELHPLAITDTCFEHAPGKTPAIKLSMKTFGLPLNSWKTNSISLFLNNIYEEAADLYLLLMQRLKQIIITPLDGGAPVALDPEHLRPIEFNEHLESSTILSTYRQLQDFCLLPEKFLFLSLAGWEKWRERGAGNRFEIRFELESAPKSAARITKASFLLHAVPAINLFTCVANPILASTDHENYPVIPNAAGDERVCVHSVDGVNGIVTGQPEVIQYGPCGPIKPITRQATYRTTVRRSPLSAKHDVFISVTNSTKTSMPVTLSVSLRCTNGELPRQLDIGDICLPSHSSPECATFRNIRQVTPQVWPQLDDNFLWRKLSCLTVNRMHFHRAESLRAVLAAFIPEEGLDYGTVTANRKRVEGIAGIESKETDRLIGSRVYRGWEFRIQLHGECFASPGDLYLFGSVLERFMGNYATKSAFVRIFVKDTATGTECTWPPRFGNMPLI